MLTDDLLLEPNIAWNDPSVCVPCDRVNTGRPEGQGLTVTSARPLWKLPVESNNNLRSLPLGLGCPTGSRKQLSKYQTLHRLTQAQYIDGRVEMFNALSGDWPAPCGVGAFQHPPSDRYSSRTSGRNSRPNCRRHRLNSASEDWCVNTPAGSRCREIH